MPAYEYTALDPAGKERRGVLEGDNARQVRAALREQSLLPVSVQEVVDTAPQRIAGFSLRRGINAMDLALLTRQLATLVHDMGVEQQQLEAYRPLDEPVRPALEPLSEPESPVRSGESSSKEKV